MADLATKIKLKDGHEVSLKGWIHRLRKLGDKYFVVLRNSNGLIQVVANGKTVTGKLDVEASISVTGTVKKDERAPGGFELHAEKIEVIGESAPDWPFHRYKSVDMEMDYRHLWLRSSKMQSVFKVRSTVLSAMRSFFEKEGFFEVSPPIFVSAACEGGSTLFDLDYFGGKAYLSQSAQLYLEAFVPSLEKVWALTPSFRAEKSRTRRHLTEYWHLEPEVAWNNHEDNMDLQEKLLKVAMKAVMEERQDVLGDFEDRSEVESWIKDKWPRIRYDDAIDEVKAEFPKIKWGDDLGTEEERYLVNKYGIPVFITHYPRSIKSFYMKVDEENPKVVLNNDLISPHVGEIVGGSEREWKQELLLENISMHKLNPKDYAWYLDLRRYGSIPHSGFGLGTERFLVSILKLEHIRDALAFPRFMNRVYP
ncbi:MAG: asparagine--tRNA ligase [Candidatus Altiarchaeota archaeon]|nr:asparagine--tRNA ligase [Candidatus Altiarchaeota archaeon]